MTAQTEGRNTPYRSGVDFVDPVAAASLIYEGALYCLNAAGDAVPGSTALNLTARGVAQVRADNSGGAAGDISVSGRAGIFRFNNDGVDTVDRTHIGGSAYIVDDNVVASTDGTGTRSAAGTIVDVDADGVWVKVGV